MTFVAPIFLLSLVYLDTLWHWEVDSQDCLVWIWMIRSCEPRFDVKTRLDGRRLTKSRDGDASEGSACNVIITLTKAWPYHEIIGLLAS